VAKLDKRCVAKRDERWVAKLDERWVGKYLSGIMGCNTATAEICIQNLASITNKSNSATIMASKKINQKNNLTGAQA